MNTNLKIGIIGYGAMGKQIETVAKNKNVIITDIIDIDNPLSLDKDYAFDVAIDFSSPKAVISNIEILSKLKKNVVVGVTGWYDQLDYVKNIVADSGIGFVWGSNFSVGMQMFFQLNALAGKIANKFSEYDVFLHEIHHKRKLDSPSGTAISIGNILLKELDRKERIIGDDFVGAIKPQDLQISASRGGEIVGEHTVYIDSAYDTIKLTHSAKNRMGFSEGAVLAAEWIKGKTGFFEFKDIFEEYL